MQARYRGKCMIYCNQRIIDDNSANTIQQLIFSTRSTETVYMNGRHIYSFIYRTSSLHKRMPLIKTLFVSFLAIFSYLFFNCLHNLVISLPAIYLTMENSQYISTWRTRLNSILSFISVYSMHHFY